MNPINIKPIDVDFNNADEDYAVRLHLPLTTQGIKSMNLNLKNGDKIWITDGEIEAVGVLGFRNGIWVAVIDEGGYKDVDEKAPYHINNLNE